MIAIIGGGIAGLTTALAFEKLGIDYHLFEKAIEINEIGAGIWLAPNALQILDWLGVLSEINSSGSEVEKMAISDHNFKEISNTSQEKIREKYGYTTIAIHRADLQKILFNKIPREKVDLGYALRNFEILENNDIKIHFDEGQNIVVNGIIGADGIHSKVRNQLFPESEIRYSGQTCWRGVSDTILGKNLENNAFEMWGGKVRFGFSRISENKVYWFAVSKEAANGVDIKEKLHLKLKKMFEKFDPIVLQLINDTKINQILRNDIIDLKPMKTWHKNNICLIGDAGHATTPNMGQGGAQAVEDAYVLSNLLSKSNDYKAVFKNFENKRIKKVKSIIDQSWTLGKMAHWQNFQGLRNLLLGSVPKSIIDRQLLKLYEIEKFTS